MNSCETCKHRCMVTENIHYDFDSCESPGHDIDVPDCELGLLEPDEERKDDCREWKSLNAR